MKPNGFCGSLESPSWFKFVAESANLTLRLISGGCGADGVQAVMLSATNCSDSATYTAVSTCSNPTGSQPVATITSLTLVAGQTYYLLIDGYQGAGCSYTIDVTSGTIRSTATPLPTPSVIFGPTTVCANATNVTLSVPKVPNATDYRFVLSNGLTGDFLRTDSTYTITNFPASGTVRVCVNYKNDCTEGTALCSNVSVTTKVNITLPTVYVCSGSTYILADGTPIDNQTTPVTTDTPQDYAYDITAGGGNCDTTYSVKVIKYALREGSRSLFLKPAETVAVCNTNITGITACTRRDQVVTCIGAAVNGCDSIVNTAIFNVKQTNTINPNGPTLNCNTFPLVAFHADTCAETVHIEGYQWFYQTAANAPLSNLNNTTATQVAATAGIYVLVVRDSVYSKTATFAGYRILIDTVRNNVVGNGSVGTLPTPTAINGRADTTICQGATATFRTNRVVGATSYSWTLARNSGTIIGASNDTSIVVRFAANSSGDTVFVRAKNTCDSSATQKITIIVFNFANLDAGLDRSVCSLRTTLTGTSSTNIGRWTSTSANGVTFVDATSPTTDVTASVSGIYPFIWTETSGACTKSDTVNITFNAPPQYTGLRDSCNAGRTNFFVKFNITAGTGPFTFVNTVTNASVGTLNTLGAFTSNALPVGSYTVRLRDVNLCTSPNFTVTQACTACFTKAGTMDTATALSVCEGDTARATYLGGYVSDGNDTLQFVLHTGNPRTGIVQRSNTPRFGFRAGMTYETRYFISVIAGDDSTRQVRLNDPCFDASTGVAVVFHRRPTVTISMASNDVCVGSCADLRYVFPTGQAPFTVTTRITEGAISRDTTVSGRPTPYISVICPTQNTTYRLVSVSDSFGCVNTTLTQQISVRTFTPLEAGTPRAPLSICSGTDTTVNLLTQLIGALPGGTWTETSVVRSTGTAFNAALASFRTRNQIAGAYRFSYVVRQVNGSPCPSDTAVVTINLLASPIADAGVNDTITCDEPTITLGGANTSTGTGITYNWSGNAGGNVRNISVQEPGTYVLRVTSPTCSATDTVIIYIDTLSPIAIIQPIAVNTLTCKLDSIILDGSRSTPLGQIEYAWLKGQGLIPQGNMATTRVISGDAYILGVVSLRNGCIGIDTITIYENRTPPSVVIQTPPTVNCKDSVATIDASGSSRGVPYTFTWRAANGGRFLRDSTTLQPKSTTAGFYELTIRDTSNGCFNSDFKFVNVDTVRPIAKASALDTIDCNNPVIGLSGRGSTLGATIGYSWIAQPGRITVGDNTLNPSVDEPGTYFLTVLNNKNFCTNRDSARVVRNTERPRNAQITIKKPSCYGECDANFRIDTVLGGTKPYLFSTDGKVFTTRNLFQNQCAGTFKLYIQDAGGCQIDTTFSINQDKQLSVSLGADTTLKLGDSLLIRVQTNTDSVRKIVWTPVADSTKCPKGGLCTEQWVRPIVGTTYKATITNNTGCSTTGTVRVSIDKRRPIFVPNIFAPNSGSGQNDKLMIYGSNVVKIIKRFQIYDRWGNGMFAQQNFKTDDPNFAWDGRIRGTNALPDVYVYFIEVEYLDNTTEILEGDFTLIR